MTTGLWESTATFKKCTGLKLSFVLLGTLDLALTVLAINLGFFEINPLVRYLFEVPVLLVLIKFVVPVLIAWLIPGKFLLPSIALLAFVVAWNVKELFFFLV